MRVGIQLHMYQMGQIGGPNLLVDWVSGDYKISDRLGVRAGKIKVPVGLFNDSQDVDSPFGRCCRKQTIPTITAITIWQS
jgi:hypothetical protein